MENEEQQHLTLDQRESIKLIKNSRGYNWEIKTLDMNIERLEDLNIKMKEKFKDE